MGLLNVENQTSERVQLYAYLNAAFLSQVLLTLFDLWLSATRSPSTSSGYEKAG